MIVACGCGLRFLDGFELGKEHRIPEGLELGFPEGFLEGELVGKLGKLVSKLLGMLMLRSAS